MQPYMDRYCGIIPVQPVDVANWREDDEFFHYPEGSRPKKAYFPPSEQELEFVKTERRYLFKSSQKRYPEQFWAEIVAYHIGCLLGVDVPPVYPAIDSREGKCASLIEWFYEDKKALFMPGDLFMQRMIKDYDRQKGVQHNFHTIRALFRMLHQHNLVMQNWPECWSKMLLFDAICGNTDRHQNNWGILFQLTKPLMPGRLSPCYDNGTSLGHELWEEHQGKKWDNEDFLRYVLKGTHHMKWTLQSPSRAGHISCVQDLIQVFSKQKEMLLSCLLDFDMSVFHNKLALLQDVSMPIKLTRWRSDLMYKLVNIRRDLLIKELQ